MDKQCLLNVGPCSGRETSWVSFKSSGPECYNPFRPSSVGLFKSPNLGEVKSMRVSAVLKLTCRTFQGISGRFGALFLGLSDGIPCCISVLLAQTLILYRSDSCCHPHPLVLQV